jgi:hypothetical protein
VEVDGVLPRHNILESRTSLATLRQSLLASQNRRNLFICSTFFVLFGGAYKSSFSVRKAIARRRINVPFLRYWRIDGSRVGDSGKPVAGGSTIQLQRKSPVKVGWTGSGKRVLRKWKLQWCDVTGIVVTQLPYLDKGFLPFGSLPVPERSW